MTRLIHFESNKIFAFSLIFLLVAFTACNKKLDIQSSRIANEEGHWSTYENARSGIIGLYGLTRAALAQNNAHWLYGELRQGDFKSLSRSDLQAVIDGKLNSGYTLLQEVSNWRPFYAAINACNLFIERDSGCLKDVRYTDAYYNLDIAQARSLRAFLYFYMVRVWGDVPFTTSSGEGGNFTALPKTDKNSILNFASNELQDVASKLPFLYSVLDADLIFPNNYYGESSDYWLNAPVNRLAAYAVLAHIAAWQGNYIDAAIYTEFVANNYGKSNVDYSSVSDIVSPTGVFAGGNPGNYKQIMGFNFNKVQGETTVDGHIENLTLAQTVKFYMSKKLPDIYIDKETISSLFPVTNGNDDRFGYDDQYTPALLYTTYFENYDAEIPVFKKIRVVNGGTNNGQLAVYNSSIIFTRLEEILLLRAEALAALGRETDARGILNNLRSKRSLTSLSTQVTGSNLIMEIFNERRRELAGEGWRWYDIVREKKLLNNDAPFMAMIANGGIYWPIAQDVLLKNTKIEQNPYWK